MSGFRLLDKSWCVCFISLFQIRCFWFHSWCRCDDQLLLHVKIQKPWKVRSHKNQIAYLNLLPMIILLFVCECCWFCLIWGLLENYIWCVFVKAIIPAKKIRFLFNGYLRTSFFLTRNMIFSIKYPLIDKWLLKLWFKVRRSELFYVVTICTHIRFKMWSESWNVMDTFGKYTKYGSYEWHIRKLVITIYKWNLYLKALAFCTHFLCCNLLFNILGQ